MSAKADLSDVSISYHDGAIWLSSETHVTSADCADFVPSDLSAFTNSLGYLTKTSADTLYLTKVPDTYKSYEDVVSSLSNDGYVTSADESLWQLSTKLDQSAAGQDWNSISAYIVYEFAAWNGKLWQCISSIAAPASGSENAVPSADTGHWKQVDMTTPDATFDITRDGALRLVSSDGSVIWHQGYMLASQSSVALSNECVNYYEFPPNMTSDVLIQLPTAAKGYVGDFVLDVKCMPISAEAEGWPLCGVFSTESSYAVGDNVAYDGTIWTCVNAHTAGAWSASDFEKCLPAFTLSTALDNTLKILVPKDEQLSKMFTFEPGQMAELYFT